MTLSTHLGPDQGPNRSNYASGARPPRSVVYYHKPHDLFTRRDAYLLNKRVVGTAAGQLHTLTDYPTHHCGSGRPVPPEEVRDLRVAVRSGRELTGAERAVLYAAGRAGQVVPVNLYRDLQSLDVKPPTTKEAAAYLQAHLADGTLRSWITEYYHRGRGKKALWTVGHSIHADDRRYCDFDLWRSHFKHADRDLYQPQGVRQSDQFKYTRWVALDADNHGEEAGYSQADWLEMYTALHQLLVAEGLPYLAQVNPRNSSYQLWVPVPRWSPVEVNDFARKVTTACPWVREVYPTKSKWAIICPLRPDKINLLGGGELPKAKCRPRTWCYDLVAAWRWHRNPTAINADAVRDVLARSFAGVRTATTRPADSGPLPASVTAPPVAKPRRAGVRPANPSKSPARGVPLRGRWLEVLAEAYIDGVEPPVGGSAGFLTPQLRLFRDGEVGAARAFLNDVIDFMRAKGWSFSDRLANEPDELRRTFDHVCRDRSYGMKGRSLALVDAARSRLDVLGFDGTFASLLRALAARRGAGVAAGVGDAPLVQDANVTNAACKLMKLTRTDHQTALCLLQRVLNHVGRNHELSYSFLNSIARTFGVTLSHYKEGRIFAILKSRQLIVKTKNYSRTAAWSIGNCYALTEKVQFVTGDEAGTGRRGEGESSCNNTISRFTSNDTLYDPLDLAEVADEVVRLDTERHFAGRLYRARAVTATQP